MLARLREDAARSVQPVFSGSQRQRRLVQIFFRLRGNRFRIHIGRIAHDQIVGATVHAFE